MAWLLQFPYCIIYYTLSVIQQTLSVGTFWIRHSILHGLEILLIYAIRCIYNYFQVVLKEHMKNCTCHLKRGFLGIVTLMDSRVANESSMTCQQLQIWTCPDTWLSQCASVSTIFMCFSTRYRSTYLSTFLFFIKQSFILSFTPREAERRLNSEALWSVTSNWEGLPNYW